MSYNTVVISIYPYMLITTVLAPCAQIPVHTELNPLMLHEEWPLDHPLISGGGPEAQTPNPLMSLLGLGPGTIPRGWSQGPIL